MFGKIFASIVAFFSVATSSPALPVATPVIEAEKVVTTTEVSIEPVVETVTPVIPATQNKTVQCENSEKIVYRDGPEKIVYRDGPERIVYRDTQGDVSALTAKISELKAANESCNSTIDKATQMIPQIQSRITNLEADKAKCDSLLSQSMNELAQYSDMVMRYKALSDKWKEMYYTAIGQPMPN